MHRSLIAFEELRQGIKDIESLADPTSGEIRIGTTPPLSASFLATVIDRMTRRHPESYLASWQEERSRGPRA